VSRERIERFFKNLALALGHCIFEDAEVQSGFEEGVRCPYPLKITR